MVISHKLLVAFLFLILGIFLQLLVGETSGIWLNFTLAVLITAAFFLNFLELLVLILFAIFVLNWQPAFSLEVVFYVVLPFLALWLHKFFPFKPWLGNLAAIFLAILVFYLAVGPHFLIIMPAAFLWDVAGGLALGAIFFKAAGPAST
jgi:hypothetical protein